MVGRSRVLVLGAGGFLGSHLVDQLLIAGYAVRAYGRTLPGLLPSRCLRHPRFEGVQGLLEDRDLLGKALQGCTDCVHLVSTTLPQTADLDPIRDVVTNLVPTLGLLELIRTTGLRRFVFVSSGGTVYGPPRQLPIPETHPTNPICSYGITKRAIEGFLDLEHRLHGLDQRVVRLANPFGERQRTHYHQGAVAVFLGKALRNEPIQLWGDGSTIRDFLYVGDAMAAICDVLRYEGQERLFNVGSGGGCSLLELLDTIARVTGRTPEICQGPARPCDVPSNVLCIERACRELGWRPSVPLEEGIERTLNSLDRHSWITLSGSPPAGG